MAVLMVVRLEFSHSSSRQSIHTLLHHQFHAQCHSLEYGLIIRAENCFKINWEKISKLIT